MSKILAILSTHTRQLASPFGISQLPRNTDETYFKHFIEHLVGIKENSTFKHKQGRLRPEQDQLVILRANQN